MPLHRPWPIASHGHSSCFIISRVRAIVLTGAGKMFCAGSDLSVGFGDGKGRAADFRDMYVGAGGNPYEDKLMVRLQWWKSDIGDASLCKAYHRCPSGVSRGRRHDNDPASCHPVCLPNTQKQPANIYEVSAMKRVNMALSSHGAA